MFLCLSVCLCVCLFFCLSIFLCLIVCLSIRFSLSVCLYVSFYKSVSLSKCLTICLGLSNFQLRFLHEQFNSNSLCANYCNYESKFFVAGTTRVEWPLVSVQKVYVATGGELEDEGKIFIVQTRP